MVVEIPRHIANALVDPTAHALGAPLDEAFRLPVRTLVQMDNPDHQAYRRLTQEWFMPANLRKLQARIREVAKDLVDRMAATGCARAG